METDRNHDRKKNGETQKLLSEEWWKLLSQEFWKLLSQELSNTDAMSTRMVEKYKNYDHKNGGNIQKL